MEILSPSPPPSPAAYGFLYGGGSLPRRDHAHALLHVAVGRSPEKTLPLLRWAFRRFGCARVALVHVHQPSPVIPTLRTNPNSIPFPFFSFFFFPCTDENPISPQELSSRSIMS
jgi:hypothetical protein